jgi:hypothetical protein
MKNVNNPIGNRTRDLPACSAVPEENALRRTPLQLRAKCCVQLSEERDTGSRLQTCRSLCGVTYS